MRAIVFHAPGSLAVEQIPDPTCGPDEVIVKVEMSGICGTDLHIFRGEYMGDFPLVPGHEFSGTVVEVGKNVDYLQIGDRVAPDPNVFCNHCEYCRNDQGNHCLNWQGVGVTRNGGFAEYVVTPAKVCYPVPAELSDAQAAFIEPLACVAYAMRRLRVQPADQVLIFGAGPMGLLLVQALRNSGASQVTVVEKQLDRLALAAQLGAAHTVPVGPDQAAALTAVAPLGFDIVIDATGVPVVIEQAFNYLKPRGQYLQFGVTPMGTTVRIDPYKVFKNDWTIIGSFAVCYSFQPAIGWLANNVIDVAPLVSDTVPLEQFQDAFERFGKGQTLKVHVRPDLAG
ncbi:MAG: zinc-dependent alcohol dehydrogenase family protein [Caldilineaceae bacterium]|nr:zinc-dependent alcohol dehydrogenase family protein [Caldilineaceae bacterium]